MKNIKPGEGPENLLFGLFWNHNSTRQGHVLGSFSGNVYRNWNNILPWNYDEIDENGQRVPPLPMNVSDSKIEGYPCDFAKRASFRKSDHLVRGFEKSTIFAIFLSIFSSSTLSLKKWSYYGEIPNRCQIVWKYEFVYTSWMSTFFGKPLFGSWYDTIQKGRFIIKHV